MLCIKISARPSTEDSRTGNNLSSRHSCNSSAEVQKYLTIYKKKKYSLRHCTYLEFGISLFKINFQGCHLIKYLKLNLLLVEIVAVSVSVFQLEYWFRKTDIKKKIVAGDDSPVTFIKGFIILLSLFATLFPSVMANIFQYCSSGLPKRTVLSVALVFVNSKNEMFCKVKI